MIKPRLHVTSNTKGFESMLKAIRALGAEAVDVGIFETSGEEVVLRAVVNNEGTEDGRIPQREFARSGFDQYKAELVSTAERASAAATKGKIPAGQALNLIGLKGQAIMRRRINELNQPPNAASTIARKGSSNPLIDTGEMLREVDYRIRKS